MLSKYVCVFVSRQLSKGQSLILNVGVGKKVRGQFWVQHNTSFSLVWRRLFQVSTYVGLLENGEKKNKDILCLNHLLPLFFSSVCKKLSRESCYEDIRVTDVGNPRILQPSTTFHCEHRLSVCTASKSINIICRKHILISLIRFSTTMGRVWRWMGS